MPTGEGEACVLVFDIVNSSGIRHERAKEFFQNVFRRCNEVMNKHYDAVNLTANAYRVKEMGDGFICSVGFPFRAVHSSKAQSALFLALEFYSAFQAEVEAFGYHQPITCAVSVWRWIMSLVIFPLQAPSLTICLGGSRIGHSL